jgi:ABC-type bacteriocin/lantibiotic exporter with double-glycine peptidase domain
MVIAVEMEILRETKNVWGQKMLVGISWDLLWIPFAAALLFIIIHFALRFNRRKRYTANR